jgi:hypothetical protein
LQCQAFLEFSLNSIQQLGRRAALKFGTRSLLSGESGKPGFRLPFLPNNGAKANRAAHSDMGTGKQGKPGSEKATREGNGSAQARTGVGCGIEIDVPDEAMGLGAEAAVSGRAGCGLFALDSAAWAARAYKHRLAFDTFGQERQAEFPGCRSY